jgi:UDPglucose 6-dehydrogenase
MDRACIVGAGVVGQATAKVFGIRKHYDVIAEKSNITIADVSRCRYCFICLPSPVDVSGNYQLEPIIELIKQIESYGSNCIYIIRSTVFPGFATHLMDLFGHSRFISNPEFLSEETAEKDAKYPPFIVLGGTEGRFLQEVKGLYESVIKSAPVILTNNVTAELIKLSLNSFFALKVIYGNQIYDYAKKVGANYETIRGVWERHPFGSKNHFQVWYKGRRGVNGHCLPKDSKALGNYANSDIVNKIVEINQQYIGLKEQNEN